MQGTQDHFILDNYSSATIAEIVTNNFRTAAVFEKYGLDFCCNGKKTITEACSEKNIDNSAVVNELIDLTNENGHKDTKFNEWGLDFLIDYIVNNHHKYVIKMLPVISTHIQKVASKHGQNHPETIQIAKKFASVEQEMKHHMMKEERILFPHIKYLLKNKNEGLKVESPYFGTIKNPIAMMEKEHQSAGDEMYEIKSLTHNYKIPVDACNTFRVTLQELKEFEEDLHKHIHLENNILFPKALALENELF
jgi:regulator of cell morphogenesis and NO signaling